MVTFIVVPLVAGFFTLFFSKLDIMIRGSRAREPIFKTAQTLESDNYHFDKREGTKMRIVGLDDAGEEIDADEGTEQEVDPVASNNLKVEKTDSAEETNAQSVEVAA